MKVDLGGVIGIAAGLSLGAVILIVICVLCYMKRNKKGPFKPKSEFSVRYTATAGEGGDTVDHTQGLLAREGSVNNRKLVLDSLFCLFSPHNFLLVLENKKNIQLIHISCFL